MSKRSSPPSFLGLMFAIALGVMLASCASLGVPAADTFNKKLDAAYNTVTAAANTTATLYTAGKITPERKTQIVAVLRTANTSLDDAALLSKTDLSTASGRLDAIVATLGALQSSLAIANTGGK